MKKYKTLSELLIDYRDCFGISQTEMASRLNIDARTVKRWENNETLIKSEKEQDIVVELNIPHQVIRNLNTDAPIAVYCDLEKRTYSMSAMMMRAENASWYKSDLPKEDERIHYIDGKNDLEFIKDVQLQNNNLKPVRKELIKESAKILPELNLVLHDQSGFYAGHIAVFPLRYNTFLKIRNQEMKEEDLMLTDLSYHFSEQPLVFYFYSVFADSLDNSYYLVNRLLSYFKEKKFKDYIFAGITYRDAKVVYLREMGMRIIWEKASDKVAGGKHTFLEGNFDMFLFGKMG